MGKKILGIFIVFVLVFTSCARKNKFDVDISDIEIDFEIKRLDREIFEIDLNDIDNEIIKLKNKYSKFFELYNARVIRLGNPDKVDYPEILTSFITDFTMYKVYNKVIEVIPSVDSLENVMEKAFKRYKYYFPEKNIPEVYTYLGGFNQSIVIADNILAVGTDKYLGENCEFYHRLGIANYLQKNMNPENIPTDALKAWVLTEFAYNDSIDNLVNNMIYNGMIQYFLDAMLTGTADSLKLGFTSDQIRWCINNEDKIWNYYIENKLLFSTDYMMINKHINPAPFTSGFPPESPGRASVWLGWKIVHAYMKRNPEIELKELMIEDDYQKILSESRYEP